MAYNPSLRAPALATGTVPWRRGSSTYPELFRRVVQGRQKQALGDHLGLQNFGVNLVKLDPGAVSSLRHWHTRQDEFVYVLEGELVLVTNGGEQRLPAGACAGFPAGSPDGHQLVNRSEAVALYLEVGDRSPGDRCLYPDVDLEARQQPEKESFFHRDGTPYDGV